MDNVNVDIKKEFEEKISNIEDHDKRKNKFFKILLNVASVILFLAVLTSAILSVTNYIKAKQKYENQNNTNSSSNVVEIELK
ncbi:MAG: hypothetical protein IJ572_03475 [Bacilli bacterium]|nr:hypothetical protein [Bacilli bacterium]